MQENDRRQINLRQFDTIRSFARKNCNRKIELEEANGDQADLLLEIMNFGKNARLQFSEKNMQKGETLQSAY